MTHVHVFPPDGNKEGEASIKGQSMSLSMRYSLFLSLLLFSLLVTSSYGKDDPVILNDCTASAASQAATDAFAEFEVAMGNYTKHPTAKNAEAYKLKARHYLSVLQCFERCMGVGDTREWQANINEVEAEVAMIQR